MNQYIQKAKDYMAEKNEAAIGVVVVLILVGIVIAIAAFVQSAGPKIVYKPAKACELLTPAKAQDFLGNKVINVEKNEPVISGNTATSKCSYTDNNQDTNSMLVAAIAVRSGINDEGVLQNKTDFAKARANSTSEAVKDIGESAYFNQTSGQLNVLRDKNWFIFSYGIGSAPESNTLDKAIDFAHKILQ